MVLEFGNPETLRASPRFAHVVKASGGSTVYVSGQVSVDGEGGLVGEGDLEAQSIQAFGNVGRALASVGASWDDVARMTIYVVDFRPDMYASMQVGRAAALGSTLPASTLIGVQALADPAYLIEVEAIAVLD